VAAKLFKQGVDARSEVLHNLVSLLLTNKTIRGEASKRCLAEQVL
jgi:hypothetical protein